MTDQKYRFEPELYRVIRSGDSRVVPPLYADKQRTLLDIERLRYFGPWVHHILLQCRPDNEIAQILTACPNVYDLALWIVYGDGAPLVPILARLPLRRLSLDPMSLFYYSSAGAPDDIVPLAQAPFDALTHLEILNISGSWNLWRELALLPRLTHLAFGCGRLKDALVERALAECAALEVLVLPHTDSQANEYLKIAETQKDPRIVGVIYSANGCLDEWEVGARGGGDIWITAEERVRNARLEGRGGCHRCHS